MSEPADTLSIAAGWLAAGEGVALATGTRTGGRSAGPPGRRGVVPRGCIESEIASLAIETLDADAMRLASFDVAEQRAWSVGLACGGEVEVMIEPLSARPGAARG